jgi:hypothetical protein
VGRAPAASRYNPSVTAARDTGLQIAWRLLDAVGTAVLLAGLWPAAAGWRPAAWILVGAVTALVGGHIWISAAAYRRTMRRPWPRVEPLPDDDDW